MHGNVSGTVLSRRTGPVIRRRLTPARGKRTGGTIEAVPPVRIVPVFVSEQLSDKAEGPD
jgi:hypothetical protein